jgi:hypothetical protein
MTSMTASAAESCCPGCDGTDGVEHTTSTPRVAAWRCTRCGMDWAVTLVNHGPPTSSKLAGHGRGDRSAAMVAAAGSPTGRRPPVREGPLLRRCVLVSGGVPGECRFG